MDPQPLSPARRLLTLAALMGTVCLVYGAVGHWAAGQGELHTLESPLDRMIPLQPAWVLVYLAIFFQALAPVAAVTDRRALERAAGAYLSLYALALPIWVFLPVTVPRDPLPIADVWSYGIALTRFIDPPANCMPSMHVALAVLAALIVRRHDSATGLALMGMGALIAFSTVATGQHWVADGMVGTLLAVAADALWFGWKPLPPSALRPLDRRWHLTWLLAYAVVALVLMSGWWFGWFPLELLR